MERPIHKRPAFSSPMTRSAILLLTNLVVITLGQNSNRPDNDLSYTRYPNYPPYCSQPEEMAKRAVPPLQSDDPDIKLVHVTSIIRHGARTPWSHQMMCWDGYWQDDETGVWNCDLTTMVSPPSAPFVEEVEDNPSLVDNEIDAELGSSSMFLFEKRYDALNHPPFLTNYLNGTCQEGQLILRGYEQELANGRHLRQGYVHDGLSINSSSLASMDERMRLFDLTTDDDDLGGRKPYEEPNLRYRADDGQRTLMSGQVLLRGMWGDIIARDSAITGENPVITVHTADYDIDVIAPRVGNCPRVADLWEEAIQSDSYQAFINSKEANTLKTIMVEELGNDFSNNVHDCLMTTMCTDRKLPEILDDYGRSNGGGKYGENIFQRFVDFGTYYYLYPLVHNDAAYSKLGMGPLWYEIIANIKPFLDGDTSKPLTKLALFSGHDSTIEPLLASLGKNVWDGKVWVPYATIFNIEIHEKTIEEGESKHLFRLVLNGDVMTSRVEGCPDDGDLCDVTVLIELVEPFAIFDRDCASAPASDELASQNMTILSNPTFVIILFATITVSSFLGGLVTYFYLTRRFPCTGGKKAYQRAFSGISLQDKNSAFPSVDNGDPQDVVANGRSEKPKSPVSRYGTTEIESQTKGEII